MNIYSTYSVKIKYYNHIFEKTAEKYQAAVDFYMDVCLKEWPQILEIPGTKARQMYVEQITHRTRNHPEVKYDFAESFYKFPSYLRRSAISESIGKVASYKSNLKNWELGPQGKAPAIKKAGRIYPAMFRDNMYVRIDGYTAKIKIYIRNTWDWLTVSLRKSDVDYILHHCAGRKECVPTLQKRGKEWYLDFAFEEKVKLTEKPIREQKIIAVDLGINQACVCSVMTADGTVHGRHFLSLPAEKDRLEHALNRIKKAQQHGAVKLPRLWSKVKGLNHDISAKTAGFIMETAKRYQADVVVFEHLELKGRKRGSSKQKLHHWKCREVQRIVTDKAHRLGIRISRVCAWGTSALAHDGSGRVERDAKNYMSTAKSLSGMITASGSFLPKQATSPVWRTVRQLLALLLQIESWYRSLRRIPPLYIPMPHRW